MLTEHVGNGRERELPKGLEVQMLRDHAAAVLPVLVGNRVKLEQDVRDLSEWIKELRVKAEVAARVADAVKSFLEWTDADDESKIPF